MAKNPFKLPGFPKTDSLPSDKEFKKQDKQIRFKKLASLLSGLKPVSGVSNPPPVMPKQGPKMPKF